MPEPFEVGLIFVNKLLFPAFFFDDVGISNLKNGYIKLSTTGESVDGNELKLNEVIEFILDDSKQKINKHKNLLLNDIFLDLTF